MSVYFEQYNFLSSLGSSLEECWNELVRNSCGIVSLKEKGLVPEEFSITVGAPYRFRDLGPVHTPDISFDYGALVKKLLEPLVPSSQQIDVLIIACNVNRVEQLLSGQSFSQDHLCELIKKEIMAKGFSLARDLEVLCLYNTCVSGLSALSIAHQFLNCGGKKAAMVFTLEPRLRPWSLLPLDHLNMLTRSETVSRSSVPFSNDRSGFVKGDGAAVALLGCDPKTSTGVELLSVGQSNDCYRLTDPDESGAGIELSLKRALKLGQVSPADIDYFSAHATSTMKYDVVEAKSMASVLKGNHNFLVSALKSQIGHTNISSALISTIVTAETIRKKMALPVLNLQKDDTVPNLNFVEKAMRSEVRAALVNASGIGGYNASALLREV